MAVGGRDVKQTAAPAQAARPEGEQPRDVVEAAGGRSKVLKVITNGWNIVIGVAISVGSVAGVLALK